MAAAKPKVLVTRNIPNAGIALLQEHCEVTQWASGDAIPRDRLIEMLTDQVACLSLLTERFDAALFDAAPQLKVVANFAVGFDNFDVAEATKRGIILTNTPDVLTDTTADFTWTLLMAAARNIVQSRQYVLDGKWRTWEPLGFRGQDISHATLGIIGFGRIGREVARRATGFQMRILYYDTMRDPTAKRDLGAEYHADLDEILREADFLTLHVPLTPATRHLIDDRAFSLMKPNAVLVNTARGAVVDPEALYRALATGRIHAAAQDVTDPEPLPADHPLLSLPNCLITPHIASASMRTRDAMSTLAAHNILAALAGERPPALINPDVWERLSI